MPENPKNLRPLTKKEILNAKQGDILYAQDGRKWRITSVKTWVRKPEDRLFGLKFGLYAYDSVSYEDGRWSYQMMAGPETSIQAPVKVSGVPMVGQTVELIKPFQEHTIHPENDKPELPAGTKGIVKQVRPLEERFREYHDGAPASMTVAFKGHYTSYNVPSTYVRAKRKGAGRKPRLSR